MEGLQGALMAAKKQWGSGVTLGKADKGAPGFPFPVTVTRQIARPRQARHWDVEELTVRLEVGRLREEGEGAEGCVAVEVPEGGGQNWAVPRAAREAIARAVQAQWVLALSAQPRDAWLVVETLAWAEFKFADLLALVPECVEAYVGEDPETGTSVRRYQLSMEGDGEGGEAEEEEDQGSEEEGYGSEEGANAGGEHGEDAHDAELSEEVRERLRERERKRQSELDRQRDLERVERERKRELAEAGMGEFKPVQLSKKQLAEMHKSKQGVRLAKTGPRHRKFAGEGSAVAKKEGKK